VGPWGYDPVRRVPLCDHWRVPVEVTEDVVFYASAYCDRLRSNQWSWPQVGIYFSDEWAGEVGLALLGGTGDRSSRRVAILPWSDGGVPSIPEETERVLDLPSKPHNPAASSSLAATLATDGPGPRSLQ
jgi:hypothetical protein